MTMKYKSAFVLFVSIIAGSIYLSEGYGSKGKENAFARTYSSSSASAQASAYSSSSSYSYGGGDQVGKLPIIGPVPIATAAAYAGATSGAGSYNREVGGLSGNGYSSDGNYGGSKGQSGDGSYSYSGENTGGISGISVGGYSGSQAKPVSGGTYGTYVGTSGIQPSSVSGSYGNAGSVIGYGGSYSKPGTIAGGTYQTKVDGYSSQDKTNSYAPSDSGSGGYGGGSYTKTNIGSAGTYSQKGIDSYNSQDQTKGISSYGPSDSASGSYGGGSYGKTNIGSTGTYGHKVDVQPSGSYQPADKSFEKKYFQPVDDNYPTHIQQNYHKNDENVGYGVKEQTFPGPDGSIYDYKVVSHVNTITGPQGGSGYGQAPAAGSGNYGVGGVKTIISSGSYGANTNAKPCCQGPFPGPSGSIYDSKPAYAVGTAFQKSVSYGSTKPVLPNAGVNESPGLSGGAYGNAPVREKGTYGYQNKAQAAATGTYQTKYSTSSRPAQSCTQGTCTETPIAVQTDTPNIHLLPPTTEEKPVTEIIKEESQSHDQPIASGYIPPNIQHVEIQTNLGPSNILPNLQPVIPTKQGVPVSRPQPVLPVPDISIPEVKRPSSTGTIGSSVSILNENQERDDDRIIYVSNPVLAGSNAGTSSIKVHAQSIEDNVVTSNGLQEGARGFPVQPPSFPSTHPETSNEDTNIREVFPVVVPSSPRIIPGSQPTAYQPKNFVTSHKTETKHIAQPAVIYTEKENPQIASVESHSISGANTQFIGSSSSGVQNYPESSIGSVPSIIPVKVSQMKPIGTYTSTVYIDLKKPAGKDGTISFKPEVNRGINSENHENTVYSATNSDQSSEHSSSSTGENISGYGSYGGSSTTKGNTGHRGLPCNSHGCGTSYRHYSNAVPSTGSKTYAIHFSDSKHPGGAFYGGVHGSHIIGGSLDKGHNIASVGTIYSTSQGGASYGGAHQFSNDNSGAGSYAHSIKASDAGLGGFLSSIFFDGDSNNSDNSGFQTKAGSSISNSYSRAHSYSSGSSYASASSGAYSSSHY